TAIDENGEEITDPVQAGAVLIENHTGKKISFVGGRDYSKENQVNFATQSKRSNGSTMKPILTYAPAFEEGIIQPVTPLADFKMPSDGWLPDNYAKGEHGLVSAREALTNSYNIPVVRIYKQLIDGNLGKKYMEKMGITTISDDEYTFPSLSIGGTTHGVTVEENTNAFSTFGNDGKFRNAYMIEKITTSDGEVIYKHESEPVKVFSPETAYLTLDIMRDVINKGTGTYIKSQLKHNDVDWAGKTGTSNDYKDAWFVGTNPNVTFGAWIGYDSNHGLDDCPGCSLSYSQRNMKLWTELINSASEINPDLVTPKEKFKRPNGIVERSYCAPSGKLPTDLCRKAKLVKADLFNEKYVPTEKDDSLISGKSEKSKRKKPKKGNGVLFNRDFLEEHGYDELDDLSKLFPQKD